ncbi:hypothetical protein ABPG74_022538 [Tetrahymena malaccensis]
MRYNQAVIFCFLLLLATIVRCGKYDFYTKTYYEYVQVGQLFEDSLLDGSLANYYEVDFEINSNKIIVSVQGKTLFDDPQIRISSLEGFKMPYKSDQLPVCQNLGKGVCSFQRGAFDRDTTKIYLEITSSSGRNCDFSIYVQQQEPLMLEQEKQHIVELLDGQKFKQFVVETNNAIQNAFAYIIPLREDLIDQKIEFTAINNSYSDERKSIPIWENGLMIDLKHALSYRNQRVTFKIFSSSKQQFLFQVTSTETSTPLELNQIKKGFLYSQGVTTYTVALQNAKQQKHEEYDLILQLILYNGSANVQVFSKNMYQQQGKPEWTFHIAASQDIILNAKERKQYSDSDDFYYVRVIARATFSYSIKAYLYDTDELAIQMQESVTGVNQGDQAKNYLLKIGSAQTISVKLSLFNIIGDNDIFIKREESKAPTKIIEGDIIRYEYDDTDFESIYFSFQKVTISQSKNITFIHNKGKDYKYIITLKGTKFEEQNKYILRAGKYNQRVTLKNNIPNKQKVEKYDQIFYKFVSPSLGVIKQIDFNITNYVGGQVTVQAFTQTDQPNMSVLQKKSNDVISFTKSECKLEGKTFQLSVSEEQYSIYTITPHISFENQEAKDQNPGIFIQQESKQILIFSKEKNVQYFYLKVPINRHQKVPKLYLSLMDVSEIAFNVFLDPNQNIISQNPQAAAFKNEQVKTQIIIQQETLEGEMILYGMVQSLNQNQTDDKQYRLSLYYHTDLEIFQVEINKFHVHQFHSKKVQYFKFTISKNVNHYIAVLANNSQKEILDFYFSLDKKIYKPNKMNNTGQFKPSEGFIITKDLLNTYCPFLNQQNDSLVLTCDAILTGFTPMDMLATLIIQSEDNQAIQVFEGDLKVVMPLSNEFKYFFYNLTADVEHVKIQVISKTRNLQVYANVFTIEQGSQDLIQNIENSPNSQRSQYQSKQEHETAIYINMNDIKGCSLNGCQVLITVCNSEKYIRGDQKEDFFYLEITNDKLIQELKDGVKYEFNYTLEYPKSNIVYFKYYANSDSQNLQLALYDSYYQFKQLESNSAFFSTEGIPCVQNSKYKDKIGMNIRTDQNRMYYFALAQYQFPFSIRLIKNSNQIIEIIDQRIKKIQLIPQEIAYVLFTTRSPYDFLVFSPNSEISIEFYRKQINEYGDQEKLVDVKMIENFMREQQKFGEINNDSHKYEFSETKKPQQYVGKIKSLIKQTLIISLIKTQFQYFPEEGFTNLIVSSKSKYYIRFQSSKESSNFITLLSGSIKVSIDGNDLPIETSAQSQNTVLIPQYQQEKTLVIENLSSNKDAFITLTSKYFRCKIKKDLQLITRENRFGQIMIGDLVSYDIENNDKHEAIFKLIIFFPTLHFSGILQNNINMPISQLSPQGETELSIIEEKSTQNMIYYEFKLSKGGKSTIKITRQIEDMLTADPKDSNNPKQIEYVITLYQDEAQIFENVNYYYKYFKTHKNNLKYQEYQAEWGTPFIVEFFNCAGDNKLVIPSPTKLFQRYNKTSGGEYQLFAYGYYYQQILKDYQNLIKDLNCEKDLKYLLLEQTILKMTVDLRSLDPESGYASYLLRVSSFPSQYQNLVLPFDQFYLEDKIILVERSNHTSTQGLTFSAQPVSCENNCLYVRGKINYITYELYLASSKSSLQEYSVCHTNLTDYANLNLQYFPEAKSSYGQLILRKSIKNQGFDEKSNNLIVFHVSKDNLIDIPKEIFYTVVATVNIQEYGFNGSQNIPLFYQRDKLPIDLQDNF